MDSRTLARCEKLMLFGMLLALGGCLIHLLASWIPGMPPVEGRPSIAFALGCATTIFAAANGAIRTLKTEVERLRQQGPPVPNL